MFDTFLHKICNQHEGIYLICYELILDDFLLAKLDNLKLKNFVEASNLYWYPELNYFSRVQ